MRRVHVPILKLGEIVLDAAQSHHVRDVLRLGVGEALELFDDAGRTARATVVGASTSAVTVKVKEMTEARSGSRLTIASAIPKGERADWMIEKLSELGVFRFVPLITERSVVHPEGKNKFERWRRIATESAKQSHRAGIMAIEPLMRLEELLASAADTGAVYLAPDAEHSLLAHLKSQISEWLLLIGPEGGWTAAEIELFARSGIQPARLVDSILRVETAVVAAAAIAACALAPASNRPANP